MKTIETKNKEAMYYEKLPGNQVACVLCFRDCVIRDGERGWCENRVNVEGKLFTLVFDRPCTIQIDPVEKEPLYHFLPGTTMLSISTASCNYRCRFCHNWHISFSAPEELPSYEVSAREIVRLAREKGCSMISHTYGEPTVHYEYVISIAEEVINSGLNHVCHTNLGIRPEPLQKLLEHVNALSIDLKGFCPDYYRRMCNADLEIVLENLLTVRKSGVHFELINLVLPTENDDPQDISGMCDWITQNLGEDTPLHFSRYYPTDRYRELLPTPVQTLERCRDIAEQSGLNFVSIGNVPGHEAGSTRCPDCGKILIGRVHFEVVENNLVEGSCPECGRLIPGLWE
jgi:pyruvate formate lyase activating enzyme